jgi:hypothetical protein
MWNELFCIMGGRQQNIATNKCLLLKAPDSLLSPHSVSLM